MLSLLAWACDSLVIWLCGQALGTPLSPGTAVLIAAGAAAGAALPAAAGYLGTYELGAMTMAAFAGVPADEALQIALLGHAIAVLPLAVVGLIAGVDHDRRAAPDVPGGHPERRAADDMTDAGNVGEPELSIVVPVFKEGEAVEPVLRALTAGVATSHEILVVYDFDEDPTVPVIERLHAELPAIRGLRNDLGRGVLNAMKAGIAASRGDYVLISMADGSDEPHIVDSMVALARDGADVVAASRYMKGGHQLGGPRLKRLMSRTAGLTLHWFGGVATHDPTNNFKLYSRRLLDATSIESQAGFELALELTVKATLAGRRVAEVPTTWRDRTAGESNFKLRQVAAATTCTGTGWRCGDGFGDGDRAMSPPRERPAGSGLAWVRGGAPRGARQDRASGLVPGHRPALDRQARGPRHRRPSLPARRNCVARWWRSVGSCRGRRLVRLRTSHAAVLRAHQSPAPDASPRGSG